MTAVTGVLGPLRIWSPLDLSPPPHPDPLGCQSNEQSREGYVTSPYKDACSSGCSKH